MWSRQRRWMVWERPQSKDQTIYYSRALCKRQKHDFQTVINFAKCTVNGVNVYSTCSVRVVFFLILFYIIYFFNFGGSLGWLSQLVPEQLPEHHLNLTNKINCFICPGQYSRPQRLTPKMVNACAVILYNDSMLSQSRGDNTAIPVSQTSHEDASTYCCFYTRSTKINKFI